MVNNKQQKTKENKLKNNNKMSKLKTNFQSKQVTI